MGRKTTKSGAKAELGRKLREMFQSLEARPVPNRLRSIVDQLDEGDGQTSDADTSPKRKLS